MKLHGPSLPPPVSLCMDPATRPRLQLAMVQDAAKTSVHHACYLVSSYHDLPVSDCAALQDTAKNMRFSINFFTSIGLGGLTDAMRDYLQNEMPRIAAERQAQAAAAAAAEASSSESDSSSDDDSSSSGSGSSDDSSSSGGSSR